MKNIYLFLFLLLFSFGCCINKTKSPEVKPPKLSQQSSEVSEALALKYQNSSVALIVNLPNTYKTYCSGVWVSKYTMVTAKHCVELEGLLEGEDVIGMPLSLISYNEFRATFPPKKRAKAFSAIVSGISEGSDIALLTTKEEVAHETVRVPERPIAVGGPAYIVGSTAGFPFTFMKGVVSQIRKMNIFKNKPPMKTVHITAHVWFGNSGGPAIDSNGNLLGICSFMMRAPGATFFVHRDEVIKLLDKYEIEF